MLSGLEPSMERQHSLMSDAAASQPIPKKSLQIRTDKPRPHACSVCTRGFARLEHLKRHERSHTNEKPFQCAACGRCFARRDLVLRHQQKLHSHIFSVVRRGSLPTSLGPFDTSAPSPSSASPSNDNIIILRNNTKAKAPLPHQPHSPSAMSALPFSTSVDSSPSHASPTDTLSHGIQSSGQPLYNPGGSTSSSQQVAVGNGNMPSPNTISHNNTPSLAGNLGGHSSFSDSDTLAAYQIPTSDFTQQPSPSTGDSPDLRDKRKSVSTQFNQDTSKGCSDYTAISKSTIPNPRHASFSAVSGFSYTNLQEALKIKNNSIPDGPTQIGFASPQFNAFEADHDGSLGPDYDGVNLDWYNLDFADINKPQRDSDHISTSQVDDSTLRSESSANGFRMRLNTIPSESQLAGNPNFSQNNNFMSPHHFHDPSHPHHIKGTTPSEIESAITNPQTLVSDDIPSGQYGTSILHLAQDLLTLNEEDSALKNSHTGIELKTDLQNSNLQKKPAKDNKRRKLGFVNEVNNLDWVEEIKGIPVSNNFPSASTSTGFLGMPYINDEFQSDDVFSLFQSKQDDLVKQRSQYELDTSDQSPSKPRNTLSRGSSKAQFTIGDQSDFVTEELRNKIIEESKVSENQFPPLADLNAYMKLYGEEFSSYFSFVHMPTLKNPMVDNFENIPMILAMCAIGALYSYHDSNTLLLFNLSKYHIHNFFENEVTASKLQLKKVPIMAHQCLVLHIFISMFLNEPNMVDITSRQMNSMVGLIKSTNFHRPLEQFLVPPLTITNPDDRLTLQNNFDYFIMAQTRIRTIQTFYQLEVIRSVLLEQPIPMKGVEIQCGSHCSDENLWKAGNSAEWYEKYLRSDNKSIVKLSNNVSLEKLAQQLKEAQFYDPECSFDKSLALLMYVHEQISTSYLEKSQNFDPLDWRINSRPQLEFLMNSCEVYFVRNGGSTIISNENQELLNTTAELKLILPLQLLARMRLCVNITPVTTCVLQRDWSKMNSMLNNLESDLDALKEASKHAIDTLNLWIHNFSVVNDAKQTSVRTPVFFSTSVFISMMILSKTLDAIERSRTLSVADKSLWMISEEVLRSIDSSLSPNDKSSYSGLLHKQSNGVFDHAKGEVFQKHVQKARTGSKDEQEESIKKCKLSVYTLGLGVRVLADAPLWPLAMRFADALKHMAVDISDK